MPSRWKVAKVRISNYETRDFKKVKERVIFVGLDIPSINANIGYIMDSSMSYNLETLTNTFLEDCDTDTSASCEARAGHLTGLYFRCK